MSFQPQKNVLGTRLKICALFPLTGYRRTGQCAVGPNNRANVVCAIMTEPFLNYMRTRGVDLVTRRAGQWGLREGDRWCITFQNWIDAYNYDPNIAPLVIPECTHEDILASVPKATLEKYYV
jgi:uncharacterized protein (DUF2237 family)